MTFSNIEVFNFEGAFRGMRNPMNSWDKADSYFGVETAVEFSNNPDKIAESWCTAEYGEDFIEDLKACKEEALKVYDEKLNWLLDEGLTVLQGNNDTVYFCNLIGPNDMKLAQNLIKAGPEHCKFMRQILVSFDVTMPRYVWSEFDTYHFNTKNSCSTMHKLLQKNVPITKDMFVYNEADSEVMEAIIKQLNELRIKYFEVDGKEKNEILQRAKAILPESFLQTRTVTTSYAELRNMYFQRRNHRLSDWREDFCEMVNSLPWAKELICYE